jgi:hypothetical protein
MTNLQYNIALVSISTISIVLFLSYLITLKKLISTKKSLTKEILDNFSLLQLIKNEKEQSLSDTEVHNENFIKFLSDSRDWAFQYIEDVQKGLQEFIDEVDSDIDYFDQYGSVLSTTRPDYLIIKKLSKAYKKLKTLMPDEEKNK